MSDTTYKFCESRWATSTSPWHIRALTDKGPKYGGGADTPSLCDLKVAWDVDVDITNHHLTHACSPCVAAYVQTVPAAKVEARTMTLKQIATRISTYLKRFENDPEINKSYKSGDSTLQPYYLAGANAAGRYVQISYINYQGRQSLSKKEAVAYLEWLDAGNVGRHNEMP